MNKANRLLLLIGAALMSFAALAENYTFVGRINEITNTKVVMSDDAQLKMPSFRPESSVTVIIDGRRHSLSTLTGVGYVDKAAITLDSDNVVTKIVVLEMNQ